MNLRYEVKRIGKCIECQQDTVIYLGEFEADTEQEAIDKALEEWNREQFGQAGALRENDLITEEQFLNAKFTARKVK